MSNANHDNTPPEYIKNPVRMPESSWDILEIEKEEATTQKPK